MKTGTMAINALTLMAASVGMAAEPRNIQTYEFPFETDIYVPCLGEYIHDFEVITVRTHEFETRSGAYHLVFNLQSDITFVGADTDRMWSGIAVAPEAMNLRVGKGGVDQWVVRAALQPEDRGEPVVQLMFEYKVTVNANGQLVVSRERPPADDWTRCVGVGQ